MCCLISGRISLRAGRSMEASSDGHYEPKADASRAKGALTSLGQRIRPSYPFQDDIEARIVDWNLHSDKLETTDNHLCCGGRKRLKTDRDVILESLPTTETFALLLFSRATLATLSIFRPNGATREYRLSGGQGRKLGGGRSRLTQLRRGRQHRDSG